MLSFSSQIITRRVLIHNTNIEFVLSAVYGLHTVEQRRPLWEELRQVCNAAIGPWIAMRDYNVVLNVDDRYNGSQIQEMKLGTSQNSWWILG